MGIIHGLSMLPIINSFLPFSLIMNKCIKNNFYSEYYCISVKAHEIKES